MITCPVEPFSTAIEDIAPLIDAHWQEAGSFKNEFARQINFPAYRALDASGKLLTVTMRLDDGTLAGYFIGVLSNDLHRITKTNPPRHVGILNALVYYIRPEYRGHAMTFIRAVERHARDRNVSVVNIRVKPDTNAAGEFLAKIGYAPVEVLMTRLIRDAADAGSETAAAS